MRPFWTSNDYALNSFMMNGSVVNSPHLLLMRAIEMYDDILIHLLSIQRLLKRSKRMSIGPRISETLLMTSYDNYHIHLLLDTRRFIIWMHNLSRALRSYSFSASKIFRRIFKTSFWWWKLFCMVIHRMISL